MKRKMILSVTTLFLIMRVAICSKEFKSSITCSGTLNFTNNYNKTEKPSSLGFAPDGKSMVVGYGVTYGRFDGAIRRWEIDKNKHLQMSQEILKGNYCLIPCVLFSPSGNFCLFGLPYKGIMVAGAMEQEYAQNIDAVDKKCKFDSLALSHDEKTLAAASILRDKIWIWEMNNDKKFVFRKELVIPFCHVCTLALNSAGNLLAIGAKCDKKASKNSYEEKDYSEIIIFEKNSIDNTWKLSQELRDHTDVVRSIIFTNDGSSMISSSHDTTIKVWKKNGEQKWQCIQTLMGHKKWVAALVFSNNCTLLASVSQDETVRIWRKNSSKEWECFQILSGFPDCVRDVKFNLSGRKLIVADCEGKVTIWNIVAPVFASSVGKKFYNQEDGNKAYRKDLTIYFKK